MWQAMFSFLRLTQFAVKKEENKIPFFGDWGAPCSQWLSRRPVESKASQDFAELEVFNDTDLKPFMNDKGPDQNLCLQYTPNEVLCSRDNKVCLIINIFRVVAQRGTKELLYTLQHKLNKNKGGEAGRKGSRVWSCPLSRGWRCHNSPWRDAVMLINKWTPVDHERGSTVRESRKPRYWNAMFCAALNRCRGPQKGGHTTAKGAYRRFSSRHSLIYGPFFPRDS